MHLKLLWQETKIVWVVPVIFPKYSSVSRREKRCSKAEQMGMVKLSVDLVKSRAVLQSLSNPSESMACAVFYDQNWNMVGRLLESRKLNSIQPSNHLSKRTVGWRLCKEMNFGAKRNWVQIPSPSLALLTTLDKVHHFFVLIFLIWKKG
jgi:hypothetical protein